MLFGVHQFPTQYSMPPHELALAAEQRGLESIWFSEHTHIPVRYIQKREQNGNPLRKFFWELFDPFVALSYVAATTTSLKIGTGVNLLVEHDPISVAKQVATLDQLSGGRFLFGVGAGWIEEEMLNHGVAYRTRFSLLKEKVLALKQIWTEEEAEFQGRFISFDKLRSNPKPRQRPHPPVIMGGEGAKSIELAVELADGWAPFLLDWSTTKELISRLRQLLSGAGRNPDSFEVSIYQNEIPDKNILAEMEAAGVKRYILTVYDKPREECLFSLDSLTQFI